MAFSNAQKKQTEPKKPPVGKVRVGSVTASIWENSKDDKTFYSVTFERRYKSGDEWKSSDSYGPGDLLELAKAADRAHSQILDVLEQQAQNQAQAGK